ncbi:hypothetical protein ACFE04_024865 [Oxalis oulophora]
MAAGSRHVGYRDNEFREQESDFGVSTNKKKKEYNNINNNQVRNGREDKVRQNDMKEKEVSNGRYRSSSSSASASDGCGLRKNVDREPGELWSDGSEDATESETLINVSKVTHNGNPSPVEKKRKFSPIVWDDRDDRDDTKLINSSINKNSLSVTALPPPPPLPKSIRQSLDVSTDGGVKISPVKHNKHHSIIKSDSSVNHHMAYTKSESPLCLASSPMRDLQLGDNNDKEAVMLEDEDYVPARHISSSRWAAGNNSPVNAAAIAEDDEMHKRRKITPSHQAATQNKSKSPEPEELKRDFSEGTRVRSSDERGSQSRSMSGDEHSENIDHVEADECYESDDVSESDSESKKKNDSRKTSEPVAAPPQRSINMLRGCRSVDEFERLNKIDEGTYGVVYRARDKKTGEVVALKKVKMEKEREGFPLTSLREINILLSFHHPSIVDVKEVVVGSSLDSIFMVMEYMEHDLKGLMETMKQPFSQSEVKCLMLQLLDGIKYLHDNWVLHRDLKTSNILLNNRGELKICDFGLARQYGSPLKPYTHMVVTLWYRPPELLLGAKQYSTAVDMWSLGCIMAELLSKEPLFNGKKEFDQLDKIFRILGTPNETIWPGFSKLPGVKVNFVKHQLPALGDSDLGFWPSLKFPATSFTGSPVLSDAGFDLLNKLLTYDPEKRITAEAALNHEWFREVPLPKSKDFMPTFPAQHAQDRRMRRVLRSPDPLEEQRRKELQQGELGTGGLFG